jgi:RNA 2',3'-cyclic 3'-phosphodiesterase
MRVFFALEPDPATLLQISSWRDRQFTHAGHAVRAANLHLTLAFVGEIRPHALEKLCMTVDQRIARDCPRGASITLDITGYWPKPGIYWLGAQNAPGELLSLVRPLANLAAATGGKRDSRAFQPHITLFRQCTLAPPAPAVPPAFELDYRHFTLFESKQGKGGVSYQPLHSWELLPPAR